MNEMQRGTTPICIDNTNITKAEMKPYVELVYSLLYFEFRFFLLFFLFVCLPLVKINIGFKKFLDKNVFKKGIWGFGRK